MARKKKDGGGGGGPNWLDTYADMVTLLLTFFVLLFAMSDLNSEKVKIIIEAFAEMGGVNTTSSQEGDNGEMGGDSAAGEITGAPSQEKVENFDDIYEYLKQYVEENNMEGEVQVEKGDTYTFLTFRKSILFDGDSYFLKSDGKEVIDHLCSGIANIVDQIGEIRFYGHTAQTEVNMSPELQAWDRELSSRRADAVLLYVQLKGIFKDPAKLISEGYGEFRPIVPHDGTEKTRVTNRRVEILISKEGSDGVSLDDVYKDLGIGGEGAAEGSTDTAADGNAAAESTAASAENTGEGGENASQPSEPTA